MTERELEREREEIAVFSTIAGTLRENFLDASDKRVEIASERESKEKWRNSL
jgi:hypothetical protein